MSITAARAALLKIWPDGLNCQHIHARDAFAALDEAEEILKQTLPLIKAHDALLTETRDALSVLLGPHGFLVNNLTQGSFEYLISLIQRIKNTQDKK